MIIINSDDFGYSKSVNQAIYRSFEENLISSTTTLVNFNEGFEDAVTYLEKGKMKMNSIGIHFNLTEGVPLTDKIKGNPKFCSDGSFNANARKTSIFRLSTNEKEMVYLELRAQMSKFIDAFGTQPTHCDSHHHVHTEWAIGAIVHKVAKEFNVNKIRISRNVGEESNKLKKLYRRLYNIRSRIKGFNGVDHFGDIVNMKDIQFKDNKSYEIMVHSIFGDNEDEVLDLDFEIMRQKLEHLFKSQNWVLSSYVSV